MSLIILSVVAQAFRTGGRGVTVKVAPGARSNAPLPLGEGAEGTAEAPATFIVQGGAVAMAVSRTKAAQRQCPPANFGSNLELQLVPGRLYHSSPNV